MALNTLIAVLLSSSTIALIAAEEYYIHVKLAIGKDGLESAPGYPFLKLKTSTGLEQLLALSPMPIALSPGKFYLFGQSSQWPVEDIDSVDLKLAPGSNHDFIDVNRVELIPAYLPEAVRAQKTRVYQPTGSTYLDGKEWINIPWNKTPTNASSSNRVTNPPPSQPGVSTLAGVPLSELTSLNAEERASLIQKLTTEAKRAGQSLYQYLAQWQARQALKGATGAATSAVNSILG